MTLDNLDPNNGVIYYRKSKRPASKAASHLVFPPEEIGYSVVTKQGVVVSYYQIEDGFYVKKGYYGHGLHFENEKSAQKVADLLNGSYEDLNAEVIQERF